MECSIYVSYIKLVDGAVEVLLLWSPCRPRACLRRVLIPYFCPQTQIIKTSDLGLLNLYHRLSRIQQMQQNKAQLKVQACQQAAAQLKGHASQQGATQNDRWQGQLTSQSKRGKVLVAVVIL